MAAPFKNRIFSFKQPDGTPFELRGSGNAHVAHFHTLEGEAVMRDANHFWYRVQPDPNGVMRPYGPPLGAAVVAAAGAGVAEPYQGNVMMSSGLRRPPHPRRTRADRPDLGVATIALDAAGGIVGAHKGLVIPVYFPDDDASVVRLTKRQIESFCNQRGYDEFGNNGSVCDYFFDVSGKRLTYTNVVAPYFEAPKERSYYNATHDAAGAELEFGDRAQELLRAALKRLRDSGFAFGELSTTSGGLVRAINLFYTGNEPDDWAMGLWPHQSNLNRRMTLDDKRAAKAYQITNMGSDLKLGTFCHETGHLLCDFPDLYDPDAAPDVPREQISHGVGVFCLMCYGNFSEKNPGQVSAYLKRRAGWMDHVYEIVPGAAVTLRADRNECAIYRNPRNAKEYYVIENRLEAGRDVSLPGSGLAIWHVDEAGDNKYDAMTPDEHYECSLVQADGLNDLERCRNDGEAKDLFKASGTNVLNAHTDPKSRWWRHGDCRLDIYEISRTGVTMSFKVR